MENKNVYLSASVIMPEIYLTSLFLPKIKILS